MVIGLDGHFSSAATAAKGNAMKIKIPNVIASTHFRFMLLSFH
jgi:hypothetical protein